MTNKTPVLALIIAVAALAVVALRPANVAAPEKKETAFERVMRTNTLRCGYAVFAPYFTKDNATGEFGGIWHDLTEATAEQIGVKVVWAEEVGLGDVGVALETGRIDAFCSMLWTAGKRARVADYMKPAVYEPLMAYVRTDDHRFDADMASLNNPDVQISVIDGEGGGLAAGEDFPKAKMVSLPQLSNYADMFNQVVTKKADVTFAAPTGAGEFMKNNPGALRPLKPIRIYSDTTVVAYGQDALRDLLNQAQENVLLNGTMDKILAKYEPTPGAFFRVALPYAEAKP